jgi:hypothetical protein
MLHSHFENARPATISCGTNWYFGGSTNASSDFKCLGETNLFTRTRYEGDAC